MSREKNGSRGTVKAVIYLLIVVILAGMVVYLTQSLRRDREPEITGTFIDSKLEAATIPYFNFEVPTELPGVDPAILDPRDTYADASEWETKALDLAERFIKNFAKYEGNAAGKALVSAGPQK